MRNGSANKGLTKEECDWRIQERNVAQWLRMTTGKYVELASHAAPYDLIWSGSVRVEIKTAEFSDGGWLFSIHRHGKLNESRTDAYVLRLLPGDAAILLGKAAIHLILPSPIGASTVVITPRSLLTQYAKHFNNFEVLELARAEEQKL